MGSHTSGIISENFFANLENRYFNKLNNHNIKFISRYVQDINIRFDSINTNEECILQYFNSMHNKIQF